MGERSSVNHAAHGTVFHGLLITAGILVILAILGFVAYRRWMCGPAQFAYTIGRTPDQQLPQQDPQTGADLATKTADDFPGFLGSRRNAAVEHIELDPDWSAHPPRLIWRQAIGAGWCAFSAVNGFAVTMEQRGKEEQVTCYSISSGKHYWTTSWNERFSVMGVGPRSTPSISGGRVYALGAWGHLVCLEGSTGEVVWERELIFDLKMHWTQENKALRFGRANSPLVTDGLVIVPGGGLPNDRASLIAYDAQTGKQRWRGGDCQISYSSPTVAELLGERQVLTVNEETVSGHSLKTGEEIWSHPWPGDSGVDANVSQAVPVSTNRVLLSKGYRRGAELIELSRDAAGTRMKANRVWSRTSVLNTKFTNLVTLDGHAYGLSDGVLECVDLATGDRVWKNGNYGDGQILRVRGLLLVLRGNGELVLVRLDPQAPNQTLGRLKVLTGTTWNNIALYGRFLLVRNATEAACYELSTMSLGGT